MTTTRETIRAWLREGVEMGATHVIVAHDSFDGSDHPAFVMLGETVYGEMSKCADAYCRIMEVYALHVDIEEQLREVRAYHPEAPPKVPPFGRNLLALLGYQLEREST